MPESQLSADLLHSLWSKSVKIPAEGGSRKLKKCPLRILHIKLYIVLAKQLPAGILKPFRGRIQSRMLHLLADSYRICTASACVISAASRAVS